MHAPGLFSLNSLKHPTLLFCVIVTSIAFYCGSGFAQSTTIQNPFEIAKAYSAAKSQGSAHPDFVLPSIDGGKPIQLSKYRGTKVLLLHFASW